MRINRFLRQIVIVAVIAVAAVAVEAQKLPDIPSGTVIRIRMIDKLSSEDAAIGDRFHATLEDPITVDGREIYSKGADVSGRVAEVTKTGRLSQPGELDLVLTTVTSGNTTSYLHVEPLVIKGESHTKSNVEKIGGGAALGAIIGAIAGGGKGAAIGAGVGGAAGAGGAAATGKKPATVDSEAVLEFTTSTVSSSVNGRPQEDEAGPPPDNVSQAGNSEQGSPAHEDAVDKETAPPGPESATGAPEGPFFTLRDRRMIRTCIDEHPSDFPPDMIKRPELPFGSERDIKRGGTLPPDAQKNARSLPLNCVRELPKLPDDMDRVVYHGQVLLINGQNHIFDLFTVEPSNQ
jgi:hypothetical protein